MKTTSAPSPATHASARTHRHGRPRAQRHAAAHVAQYIHELSERHGTVRRAFEHPAPRIAHAGATR
jgi:hypothetical protein